MRQPSNRAAILPCPIGGWQLPMTTCNMSHLERSRSILGAATYRGRVGLCTFHRGGRMCGASTSPPGPVDMHAAAVGMQEVVAHNCVSRSISVPDTPGKRERFI